MTTDRTVAASSSTRDDRRLRIVLMGAPGSGKGTQGRLLSRKLGVPTISTGDLFRDHLRRRTELGVTVAGYLDSGEFVPDVITDAMVRDRIGLTDAVGGFILDGYPRTLAQVEALNGFVGEQRGSITAVVALEVDRATLLERMRTRAQAEARADDDPEVVIRRLEIYEAETAPLIEHYRSSTRVITVDGSLEPARLSAMISSRLRARE
ncbi:adenylate kinase [Herbiconiux sp. CPCC 203407]|uniref:Adenylate kinase n=1 Tax=Herbiconiux oxytropis TaxID=2970915 RepID=A0AA41XIQ7_9MICO|nr:adenylate kinase [Herbiconiux oxytropis]MCS5721680.1 adenylate kinase [Herbiconiux oxytropis]MCS5726693.1 adenylate kinase [Herbiconiux oxytropis]